MVTFSVTIITLKIILVMNKLKYFLVFCIYSIIFGLFVTNFNVLCQRYSTVAAIAQFSSVSQKEKPSEKDILNQLYLHFILHLLQHLNIPV